MSHRPVLLGEVLRLAGVAPGDLVVDATLGPGGHARAFREMGAEVVGIERDPRTVERFGPELARAGIRVLLGDHRHISRILGDARPRAVLFDLGLSSFQVEESGGGFSYMRDEDLDMRYDPTEGMPAKWFVNRLTPVELEDLIRLYGQEPMAVRIVREIMRRRPIGTTRELREAIAAAVPRPRRRKALARVFQALRIAVNRELESAALGMAGALAILEMGGRLLVISYHSLEDRLSKGISRLEGVGAVTPGPVRPSPREVAENPRARSAKLRVYQKERELDEDSVGSFLRGLVPSGPLGVAQ